MKNNSSAAAFDDSFLIFFENKTSLSDLPMFPKAKRGNEKLILEHLHIIFVPLFFVFLEDNSR